MKQKSLLFSLALFACTFSNLSAQEVLISENFSSEAWQTEFARLNPGSTDGTVEGLINKEATNLTAYTTPLAGGSYTSLNQGYDNDSLPDFYFGKYRLIGAIEVKPVLPCPVDGHTHAYSADGNGERDIAFRLQNSDAGAIYFPEIASAGLITLHIRNGNSTKETTVNVEKFVDEAWVKVHTFTLQPNGNFDGTYRDEVLTQNLDLEGPVTLRLVNNDAASKKFMNLYEVEIQSRVPSAVGKVVSNPFKIAGRTLMTETPVNIAIYNTIGALVFEQSIENSLEIPATVGNGVFVVKSALGTQKLILK